MSNLSFTHRNRLVSCTIFCYIIQCKFVISLKNRATSAQPNFVTGRIYTIHTYKHLANKFVLFRLCLAAAIEHSDSPQVKCPFKDDAYSCDMDLLEREIKAVRKYLISDITHFKGVTFYCKSGG